jgi:hypothetical protein
MSNRPTPSTTPNSSRTHRPAEPSPSTLQALEAQATPELMQQLQRYAQARAKLVRRAGSPVSETYARELVDDVYADTRIGDLPWDPQCGLLDHLRRAIKRRTWLEIRHAHRVSLVSLEAANDETMSPQIERALARAPRSDCNPTLLHAVAAAICQQLRSLVSRDVGAAAIVRCWADGFVEKAEVLELTGLTKAAYNCARERLRNACSVLPSELREAAQDVLRDAA